ncbi:MAG: hypothetical protein ABIL44_07435 [candidate division WOR-3 bacterium]
MIVLVEPDEKIRKRLSDLLGKERIIGVASGQQAIELLCKYKHEINLIIIDFHELPGVVLNRVIFKLCERLFIEVPPILGLYKKEELGLIEKFEREYRNLKFIEFDENSDNFVEYYINAIRELYPEVMVDIEKAKKVWTTKGKQKENFIDLRNWLKEEGFLEIEEVKKQNEQEEKDYKKMYFELKEKYEKLLGYVKELLNSVKE